MMYNIIRYSIDDCIKLVYGTSDKTDATVLFESDSMHECFTWCFRQSLVFPDDKFGKLEVSNLITVWCVYWSDFDEQYYVCPDKGDSTLDNVCFKGSEKECNEFFQKHFIKEIKE